MWQTNGSSGVADRQRGAGHRMRVVSVAELDEGWQGVKAGLRPSDLGGGNAHGGNRRARWSVSQCKWKGCFDLQDGRQWPMPSASMRRYRARYAVPRCNACCE
jgi:hypothetical protein